MAYNTRYQLDADPWPESLGVTIDADEGFMGMALEADGSTREACSWYEHERDVRSLSLKFPGVLFTLKGAGEQVGDLWMEYYCDGKIQRERAVITYPRFDESKLV
jgi:hypothetical protein